MNEAWHRSEIDFFSTLIHELSHATGHASRLNRAGISQRYGLGYVNFYIEELIAQRSCQLVMQSLGLNSCPIEYKCSTRYLLINWNKIEEIRSINNLEVYEIETQAFESAQFILKKVLKFSRTSSEK
jgi:antirestriction protein ArdC